MLPLLIIIAGPILAWVSVSSWPVEEKFFVHQVVSFFCVLVISHQERRSFEAKLKLLFSGVISLAALVVFSTWQEILPSAVSATLLLLGLGLCFGIAPFERIWVDALEAIDQRQITVFLIFIRSTLILILSRELLQYKPIIFDLAVFGAVLGSLLSLAQSNVKRYKSYIISIHSSLSLIFVIHDQIIMALVVVSLSCLLNALLRGSDSYLSWPDFMDNSHRFLWVKVDLWLCAIMILPFLIFLFGIKVDDSLSMVTIFQFALLFLSFFMIIYRLSKHKFLSRRFDLID